MPCLDFLWENDRKWFFTGQKKEFPAGSFQPMEKPSLSNSTAKPASSMQSKTQNLPKIVLEMGSGLSPLLSRNTKEKLNFMAQKLSTTLHLDLGGIVTSLKTHRLPENCFCTSLPLFPKEHQHCRAVPALLEGNSKSCIDRSKAEPRKAHVHFSVLSQPKFLQHAPAFCLFW